MPWVSYHLLNDALVRPGVTLADTIAQTVSGFVSHASYAAAAANSHLPARDSQRRLREHFAHDANPIAALFRNAGPSFEARWNALNRALPLGAATFVRGAAMHREPRSRDDCAVRARLAAECIALAAEAFAEPDEPLCATADFLSLPTVAEILSSLYAEPTLDAAGTAARLGCSLRTLQRELASAGVHFTGVRQAVRISLAGSRLRERNESTTATALATGFHDAPHFNHAWRSACAMSPSGYRALVRVAGWGSAESPVSS